jgi:hypothetical protein
MLVTIGNTPARMILAHDTLKPITSVITITPHILNNVQRHS